jgi:hypothetical protein
MQLTTTEGFAPLVARLHGLDPKRRYKVKVVEELSANDYLQKSFPGWWPEVTATGAELSKIGLEMAVLRPEQGLMLQLKSLS